MGTLSCLAIAMYKLRVAASLFVLSRPAARHSISWNFTSGCPGLTDDTSSLAKGYRFPHNSQTPVSRFERILIHMNISLRLEVLVVKARLSRSSNRIRSVSHR